MASDIKNLSLDSLFSKLHQLMSDFAKDLDGVIEDNKEVGIDDIRTLRDHLNSRLNRNEEISDNKKLLKLLNLFSEDKAVMEIIREDADEWVELLNNIELGIKGGKNMTERERNEVREIKKMTLEIKSLIRKGS